MVEQHTSGEMLVEDGAGGPPVDAPVVEPLRQADEVPREAIAADVRHLPGPVRVELISQRLTIPTIGIGAGVGTDGQILLCHDLLGVFTDFKPKFTKRFAKLTEVAVTGIKQYIKEVKDGSFPDDDHSYTVKEEEYEKFAAMVRKRRQV